MTASAFALPSQLLNSATARVDYCHGPCVALPISLFTGWPQDVLATNQRGNQMAVQNKNISKQEPTSRVRKALVAIALCLGLVAAPAISGVFTAEPIGAQPTFEDGDAELIVQLISEVERLQGEVIAMTSELADSQGRVDRLRANVRVQQERSLTNIRWRQRLQGIIAERNATIEEQNETIFFQGQEISFLRNAIPQS